LPFGLIHFYGTVKKVLKIGTFIILLPIKIRLKPGNTKGGSITVPLTSCLTGLELAV
jgi:hypothetical protein